MSSLSGDSGAWLTHGNMTDNMVDVNDRIANRQEEFQPPFDRWLFVHYAKPEEVFLSNFNSLLLNSNHSAAAEAGPGPFTLLPEGIDMEVFNS